MRFIPSLPRLSRDIRGGVTMIGALSLSSIVGMTGLAMEAGHGYAQKVENQRIADAAALAAALAFSANSDVGVVLPTARAIAVANGLASTAIDAPAPTTDAQGRQIITATVTTAVPLYLSRILTTARSYSVASTGVAAVTPGTTTTSNTGTPGCIIALSTTATTGIAMTGGTSITASGCAINANRAIALSGGARLTTTQVNSGGSVSYPSGTTLTTTPVADNIVQNRAGAAADPLGTNAAVTAALDKAANTASYPTAPAIADPVTPNDGDDWTFDWNGNAAVQAFKTSGGDFTVPASPPGTTYKVKRLTVGGGVKVTFSGATSITVSNGLKNEGTVTLGSGGNWKINGGFDTGSSGFAFATNTWHIGSGAIAIKGSPTINGDIVFAGTFTVGGGSDVTFGPGSHAFAAIDMGGKTLTLGAGNLNVPGGIIVGGGGTTRIGAGNVSIGKNTSTNRAIYVEGGAKLYFGNGLFSTSGSIVTLGGTTIEFGATANHYINGNLDLAGSATFGAGAYTINGSFTNGTGGAMTGTDVSFFLTGAVTLGGGSGLNLKAPTSTTGEALTDILFATRSTAATTLKEGAQNVLAGVWYAPNSAFTMSGGAGISAPGRCFMLVTSTVSLDGGTAASTSCASVASGSSTTTTTPTTVALIR